MSGSTKSFPTTKWALIASSVAASGVQSRAALAELCTTYRYPIYSFIRARSPSADIAQDLTQEFFVQFINGKILAAANPAVGRFRAYLAASLKHFLSDQEDRRGAKKRGGGTESLRIDLAAAEQRFARELISRETPDKVFDRQWAVAVTAKVCDQLCDQFTQEGRADLFHGLRNFLPGGFEPAVASYATVAAELGMSEGAVKVAIHRLRRRYRELLRANVSHTLTDPNEVEDEIRFLINALSA